MIAVASKHFDDLALGDLAFGARLEHAIDLGPKGGQPGDLAVNGDQMRFCDGIDGCTGLVRPSSQIEKAPDIFDLEAKIAGVTDEKQPPQQILTVTALAASRTGRLGHQTDLLVVAQRLHGIPGTPGQLSYGEVHGRFCLLKLQSL